jgi:putative cell wall-binding protein
LLSVLPVAPAPAAAQTEPIFRSAGADRIETAALNATTFWDTAEQAILATASDYPDALAAWPLAARLDAPLLLTRRDELPAATLAALRTLDTETVWILGGTAVVADAVEQALEAEGLTVRRLAGDDRFATARLAALEAGRAQSSEVLLALGAHPDPNRGWPDATASGAFAALDDTPPILLTGRDQLPQATVQALEELRTGNVIVIGGPAAISDAVVDALESLGYGVDRLGGESRFHTSTRVVGDVLARTPGKPRPLIAASGGTFPDALTAGPLAARLGAPIQLVPADDLAALTELRLFLRSLRGQIDQLVITGGSAAVSDQVEDQLGRDLDLDGGADPAPVGDVPDDFRPTTDITIAGGRHDLSSVDIPPGVIVTADGDADLRVSGPVTIAGALATHTGAIQVSAGGDLIVRGIVQATDEEPGGDTDDATLRDQATGVLLTALGRLDVGGDAVLRANGPIVVTDDPTQLDRTPTQIHEETASASGDHPTLVPLPPDDPAFTATPAATGGARIAGDVEPPHIVHGTTDVSHPVPGAPRIVLFRFRGHRDLVLEDWQLDGPQNPAQEPVEAAPGDDAAGRDGRRGADLSIWNDAGEIRVLGVVVLRLGDGQDGQTAEVGCGTATGGDGGTSGQMRMTASQGIDVTGGTLRIIPGRAGDGGQAFALGTDGCDVETTGGAGASELKRLLARGAVNGLPNVSIARLEAGWGGLGSAIAGDGADGDACAAGEAGGSAVATGGAGGPASLDVGTLPVVTDGVRGGWGGAGVARGGAGGAGGDCADGGAGGAGGMGGTATANGGDAGSALGPGRRGGVGGDAIAFGGAGGRGGNACAEPRGAGGAGGDGGRAEGTTGADGTPAPPFSGNSAGAGGDGGDGGDGDPPGAGGIGGEGVGDPDDLGDGLDGQPGEECPIIVAVLVIAGRHWPIEGQFSISGPEEGCELEHWHSFGLVHSLESEGDSAMEDPDPEGCGHGPVEEVTQTEVEVTAEEWAAFQERSGG